ncbi:MAG: hemerythrin domain-containing protein [Bdellovibrionota bacterium]
MHLTQTLQEDHHRLVGLFRQYEAARIRTPQMRPGIIRELIMELQIHHCLMREILCPELRSVSVLEVKPVLEESARTQDDIEMLLDQVAKSGDDPARQDELLFEVIETAQRQFEVEQRVLFPEAERRLASSAEKMRLAMQERRKALLKEPKFRGAHPKLVQNPSGGEQSRKVS